ncbi:hypothetical protein SLEP1_g16049 [Rubroshorea leprosula]|uniref:Uncharacterized protein n=1 Tax=Rubroshorea leprosula TaxID=152421 RepID=A0AAV5J167_9ROSI|nr:hypothetical protein SLEP1_g16049 [Rubroshorea leprosula]
MAIESNVIDDRSKNEDDSEKQSMKNPPPSLRNPEDPNATQIGETKRIFKKLRKIHEKMAAKAAVMGAEASSLRAEMDEMVAAAEQKKEEFKSVKEKRDRRLAKYLLMSVKEQVLWEILFPSSGNY